MISRTCVISCKCFLIKMIGLCSLRFCFQKTPNCEVIKSLDFWNFRIVTANFNQKLKRVTMLTEGVPKGYVFIEYSRTDNLVSSCVNSYLNIALSVRPVPCCHESTDNRFIFALVRSRKVHFGGIQTKLVRI